VDKQAVAFCPGRIHNSITRHERQFEGILALIADRARMVAKRLNCDRHHNKRSISLPGGSGCCCRICRRQVTVVCELLSAQRGARKEILRVENAETDGRIEAAICREREAKALLMIPIYRERVVAGVLEGLV